MKPGVPKGTAIIRIPKLAVSSKCMNGHHTSCFSKGCTCGCHGNPKENAA